MRRTPGRERRLRLRRLYEEKQSGREARQNDVLKPFKKIEKGRKKTKKRKRE